METSTTGLKMITSSGGTDLGELGDQEPSSYYAEGGYHPVQLGDIYGGYRIIRKLGWGQFSTVWLARDIKRKRFVAIKIIKSSRTKVALHELKLLNSAMGGDGKSATKPIGFHRVINKLDSFAISGPHGDHMCIVFELLGPSLLSLIVNSKYCGIQIQTVKTIIKQVLQGLEYLHMECQMIHTDIKPENVLLPGNRRKAIQTSKMIKQMQAQGNAIPKSMVCNLPEMNPAKLKSLHEMPVQVARSMKSLRSRKSVKSVKSVKASKSQKSIGKGTRRQHQKVHMTSTSAIIDRANLRNLRTKSANLPSTTDAPSTSNKSLNTIAEILQFMKAGDPVKLNRKQIVKSPKVKRKIRRKVKSKKVLPYSQELKVQGDIQHFPVQQHQVPIDTPAVKADEHLKYGATDIDDGYGWRKSSKGSSCLSCLCCFS